MADSEPASRDSITPSSGPRAFILGRWSLRALLLLVTFVVIASALVGYHIQSGKRQAIAIAKIEALGGEPVRTVVRDGVFYTSGAMPEPRLKWLHNFLGEDYFVYVPFIDLANDSVTEEALVEMVPSIEALRLKEGLNEEGESYIVLQLGGNPNLDDEFIDEIRRRLPHCKIISPSPKADSPFE